jgi:DNA gyrase subunit B
MSEDYKAESIKVLSGLDAVRMRPAMYIGNTGIEGFHHLAYEIIDNSIDEALAGFCNKIIVILNDDNSITIEDNGRGIPVEMHPTENIPTLEVVLTKLHAGGKFDNYTYKVSGGLHGVGISVVNALSDILDVEVYRNNRIYFQKYSKGYPITELKEMGKTNKNGTKVTFKPDNEIFKETSEFNYDILHARLRELAFLNPFLTIELIDSFNDKKEEFKYEGGLISFVESLNSNKELVTENVISISGENNDTVIDVAFQYNSGYSEKILSFVNNIRTREGGTHEVGFRQALTKCINKYISDDIVPKNMKEKIEGDDVREGLTVVLSVKIPNPQFEGQTKTKLGNNEVRYSVFSFVSEKLSRFLEENPSVSKKILLKIVETARAREAARKARDLTRKSGAMDFSMAGKLADCQEKNPKKREIFIVEGDSAGGSAKQGRDRKFQAILPLRGKIMNVEKARLDKILSSDEIKHIISALGAGIGLDGFDIAQLKYHKIVIMSDADVDGSHIRTLILTFFYRQMFPLLDEGMLYIAQPPLYRIAFGKNEVYMKNDHELNLFLLDRIIKDLKIKFEDSEESFFGDKLKEVLSSLFNLNDNLDLFEKRNINKELLLFLMQKEIFSSKIFEDTFFIESFILEIQDIGFKVSNIKKENDLIFEITIKPKDIVSSKIILNPDFIKQNDYKQLVKFYKTIKPYLNKKLSVIRENQIAKEYSNLFEVAKILKQEAQKGISIQRYKGLGEMNPEQLWKTTMDPESRTLLKVTLNDAEEAEKMFTVLMGEKIEPRKDFIYSHALEVKELDI